MHERIILPANTSFYLSEEGYYGYHYVNRQEAYSLKTEAPAKPLSWKSGCGDNWQAYLIPFEYLTKYKTRSCNVIWVKENNVD